MNAAARLRWRLDPASLFKDVVGEPDQWQANALRSSSKRQIYLTSRQAGKSSTAAAKALHKAIMEPGSLTLLLSPSLHQSQEIFKKFQAYYRKLRQPCGIRSESALRMELGNGSRVLSLPGSSQTIVGYTADLLVIDEAARTPPELLEAALPMVAVSGGTVIPLSTPAGARGWFYELWTGGDPTWERFEVMATECPRITSEHIEEARNMRGSRHVQQEYFCSFEANEEAFFRPEDLARALTLKDLDAEPLFPEAC